MIVPPSTVLALLALHSAKLRIRSRRLIDFGGVSYSLYLIHIPVLETLRATSAKFPILTLVTPVGAFFAVIASCALAMLVYHKLEMPMLKYIHAWRRAAIDST
jgi:peptidoglycan/LPS O-acetylase OafA/YrhL